MAILHVNVHAHAMTSWAHACVCSGAAQRRRAQNKNGAWLVQHVIFATWKHEIFKNGRLCFAAFAAFGVSFRHLFLPVSHTFVQLTSRAMSTNQQQQPETAGHESPDDAAAGSGTRAAEERLNALVLSTPRAGTAAAGTSSSGTRSLASTAATATANAATCRSTGASTTTPLSSARASRSAAVVGDGSFEELMKERARVSWLHTFCHIEINIFVQH
jgi:hypothetical protein